MQHNPTPEPGIRLSQAESGIHTMLIATDEQRPWSVHEIELEIGDASAVKDALAQLHGAGLIHRCGDFAWATRAAIAADQIAI